MTRLLIAVALAATPAAALAHVQGDLGDGVAAGFLHPMLGLDHLVAMVAVGLWGAQLGMPLLIALPIVFPLMMTVGAVWAIAGMPLPATEIGIALSALALGLFVVSNWRAPVWAAVAAVAAFASFHGYAHGAELPNAEDPLPFTIGFVCATGLLHLIGIGIGEVSRRTPRGAAALRVCGGVVAAIGAAFSLSAFGVA